ncbi:MAG: trypsin-like peptidase domain-containing protein [Gammaproteobacteria bacterium]
MQGFRNIAVFLLQSAIVGLALAFVAVALRPDLLGNRRTTNTGTYADAVAASAPAVVNLWVVRASAVADDSQSQSDLRDNFGSGVIVDTEGRIITNEHLVTGADEIFVTLADGRSAVARIVGTDPDTDLALLQIDLPDIRAVRFGRSDTLRIGDVVLAIGNSFGIGQSVTQGIISATGRSQLGLSELEDFIQTDAPINPGNSGGALVDADGELIGVSTALLSASEGSVGIGFAIPVNLVRGVIEELVGHGRVIRGSVGFGVIDLASAVAVANDLDETATGVLITRVGKDYPAQQAGLLPGDIITHMDGETILGRFDLRTRIARLKPGATIHLSGRRKGEPLERDLVVTERVATLP